MKTCFALVLLLALSGCKPDRQFVISGTIEGDFTDEWIYLNEFMESEPRVDSSLVEKGKFSFRGTVDYPELFVLHNNSQSDFRHFPFMLEPAKMKIKINHDDWAWGSEIKGGPVNDEYNNEFRYREREIVNLNREIDKKMLETDSLEQIEFNKMRMDAQDEFKQANKDYLLKHPESPISPYLLGQMFFGIPFDESQEILNGLSDENKQTSICLTLQNRLDMMKEYENGSLGVEE